MRFSLLLFTMVACTHSQPPPPPLSVPPANAAVPATPVPAPGSAPPIDLASPITATGVEQPVGVDWGAQGDRPAGQIFKNVKVLNGASGNRFMAAMQSMRGAIGQKCVYCHEAEKKDFASDAKPPKERARLMIRMNNEVNTRTFEGKVRVTCWTCHRGEAQPPKPAPFEKVIPKPLANIAEADLNKPAEAVFKDIRSLRGMQTRQFAYIMGFFARELGVKCTHCHQQGDFAADKPEKQAARQILAMTSYVANDFYGGNSPVGCGTCHQGQVKPPRTSKDLP